MDKGSINNGSLAETTATRSHERIPIFVTITFILAMLAVKLQLLIGMPVNQDEFAYLSRIYDYQRGALSAPWQNIHVHLFQWLHLFARDEITQIMAGRIAMFCCFLGTLVFAYLLARHFLGISGSLFSVLCYISLTFTLIHGASFRSDTPAIFLIAASLWLFVARGDSMLANMLSGVAMSLAGLFTIKAGIYLILFAALLLIRPRLSRAPDGTSAGMKPAVWFACALMGGFALFYCLHRATLAPSDAFQQGKFITGSYSSFIDLIQFFPALQYFLMTLRSDTLIWLLLTGGLVINIIDLFLRKDTRIPPTSYLFVFALPLLSLLVYRNAFPYFYVFILPCTVMLCGYTTDRLASFLKGIRSVASSVVLGFLALAISTNGTMNTSHFRIYGPQLAAAQKDLLTVIHRIFPQPVTYFDGCRMVSSFPNAGFFMSSAGMRSYYRYGEKALKDRIIARKPLFLLANVPNLDVRSMEPPPSATGFALRQDDWDALRSCFIHHWGPVWVLGKHFSLTGENPKEQFDIVAEGSYSVETEGEVILDDMPYRSGMVVSLREGAHTIEAKSGSVKAILRWGNHLYRPDNEPTWPDLFLGPFL